MLTQFLTLSNGKIAYDDQGVGPLVLCIPSLGDIRAEYRFLTPSLIKAGFRVVTMDIRGLGETSTGWSDYTVGGIGSDIVGLLRHLNAGPALVIGTSMAAGAAICATAEAPELISGLVLIGPFVRVMRPHWQSILQANIIASPLWGVSLWIKYFTSLFPTAKPADFDQYLNKLRTNLKEPGRLQALKGTMSDSKAESEAVLSQIKVPVHIIMGSLDPDFKQPVQEVQQIVDRLKSTKPTTQMIEGAGHYPHVEMPDQATASILTFFKSIKDKA